MNSAVLNFAAKMATDTMIVAHNNDCDLTAMAEKNVANDNDSDLTAVAEKTIGNDSDDEYPVPRMIDDGFSLPAPPRGVLATPVF